MRRHATCSLQHRPGYRAARMISLSRIPVAGLVRSGDGTVVNDAIARLARHAVVLLGEAHDDAEHHRWQLHTVAGLHALRPDLALGFEMFSRRLQPGLDRWTNGELSEAAFLAEVEWERVWGFRPGALSAAVPFRSHAPAPDIALNIERDSQKRFAADPRHAPCRARGCRRSKTGHRRLPRPPAALVPARPDGRSRSERRLLPRFARFVRAQQFWIAPWPRPLPARRDGRPVVGIMGRGHVEYRDGVAFQLAALGVGNVATALPWPADAEVPTDDPTIADLLFGVTANGSNPAPAPANSSAI